MRDLDINAIDVKKFEAVEIWVRRKMTNNKWQDHVKNLELRLVEECSMVNTILKRQRQWV